MTLKINVYWHQNVAKEITEKMSHFSAQLGHRYPQGLFYKISQNLLLFITSRALTLLFNSRSLYIKAIVLMHK